MLDSCDLTTSKIISKNIFIENNRIEKILLSEYFSAKYWHKTYLNVQ